MTVYFWKILCDNYPTTWLGGQQSQVGTNRTYETLVRVWFISLASSLM